MVTIHAHVGHDGRGHGGGRGVRAHVGVHPLLEISRFMRVHSRRRPGVAARPEEGYYSKREDNLQLRGLLISRVHLCLPGHGRRRTGGIVGHWGLRSTRRVGLHPTWHLNFVVEERRGFSRT